MNVYFLLCMLVGFSPLLSGASEEVMKNLHKEIGEKLIGLRKQHPDANQHVYSILDQVGKLHNLAQDTCHKEQAVKKQFLAVREQNKALSKELCTLKAEIAQAKASLEAMNKKMAVLVAEKEAKKVASSQCLTDQIETSTL